MTSPDAALVSASQHDAAVLDGVARADGGERADAAASPASAAGCSGASFPVCVDFEGATLGAGWGAPGTYVKLDATKAAHGKSSVRFTNLLPRTPRRISTTALGGVGRAMWGRFYMSISPGAPMGHGALVAAYGQAGNWYELGFQFGAYHGDWHHPAGVPERWMNSNVKIPGDRWVCVEFLFDGATPAVTKI